jgi:Dolichyl-phosphate-mannose-protein mannosyltransferase
MLAGACAGLGMLGKYSTGILLLALAGFILIEPTARRRLRTSGPWLAVAASLLVLSPHILALGTVHYGPLRFPFRRASTGVGWEAHLLFPLQFASAQVLDILPAVLLLAVLWRSPRAGAAPLSPGAVDRRYIAMLCLAPVAICLAISGGLGLRLKDMWGAPLWDYVGLFGVMMLPEGAPRLSPRFVVAWAIVLLLGPLAYAAQFPGQALTQHKPLRGQFPGKALAQAIDAGWHRVENQRPLRYVAGDVWLAGNIAFALWQERPSVLIDGDFAKSPWVRPADIACRGAVLVWQGKRPAAALLARFPGAQQQPPIELPYQTWNRVPPMARFGWAIVAPHGDCDPAGRGAR